MHSFICFFVCFNVTWVHILSLGGSPHCTYMHLFPLCCHPANLVINMPGYISRKKIRYQYLTGDEKQELCNCAFLWYFLKMLEIVELGKLWLKSQHALASTSTIVADTFTWSMPQPVLERCSWFCSTASLLHPLEPPPSQRNQITTLSTVACY